MYSWIPRAVSSTTPKLSWISVPVVLARADSSPAMPFCMLVLVVEIVTPIRSAKMTARTAPMMTASLEVSFSFPNNIDSPIRYHCKMPRYGRDTKYLYVYLKPAAASAALPGSSSLSNTQSTIVCNRFLMFISDG